MESETDESTSTASNSVKWSGFEGVKRWTTGEIVFEKKYLIMPINEK
jgi:Ulp1 family protease